MMKAEFNQEGRIEFSEVRSKPRDWTRLQSAMFMDRPDLWQSKARNRRKPVMREQQRLL